MFDHITGGDRSQTSTVFGYTKGYVDNAKKTNEGNLFTKQRSSVDTRAYSCYFNRNNLQIEETSLFGDARGSTMSPGSNIAFGTNLQKPDYYLTQVLGDAYATVQHYCSSGGLSLIGQYISNASSVKKFLMSNLCEKIDTIKNSTIAALSANKELYFIGAQNVASNEELFNLIYSDENELFSTYVQSNEKIWNVFCTMFCPQFAELINSVMRCASLEKQTDSFIHTIRNHVMNKDVFRLMLSYLRVLLFCYNKNFMLELAIIATKHAQNSTMTVDSIGCSEQLSGFLTKLMPDLVEQLENIQNRPRILKAVIESFRNINTHSLGLYEKNYPSTRV